MSDIWKQARETPISDVLTRIGAEKDKHDKRKWRMNGKTFSISKDGRAWLNVNGNGNKGFGSIDLVSEILEISPKEALNIILGYNYQNPKIIAKNTAIDVTESVDEQDKESRSFVPDSDVTTWRVVRDWLTRIRMLNGTLIDDLHNSGLIYSDSQRNAIFLRNVWGTIGCEVRGTRGIAFKKNWGGNGLFKIPAIDNSAPVVVVEGALDAIALRELGHFGKIVSSGGGCPQKAIDYLNSLNAPILSGFDEDGPGNMFFLKLKEQLPEVSKLTPAFGLKDWNDQLISQKKRTMIST